MAGIFRVSLRATLVAACLAAVGCSGPDSAVGLGRESAYERGQRLQDAGEYGRAIEAFEGFRKGSPNSPLAVMALVRVGECHEALKHYDQALAAYGQAAAQDSGSVGALAKRSKISLENRLRVKDRQADSSQAQDADTSPPDAKTTRPRERKATSTAPVKLPPRLIPSVKLVDPTRNDMLDAGETVGLAVTLANKGRGAALEVQVGPELVGKAKGVKLSPMKAVTLDKIEPGRQRTVTFHLKANEDVKAQRVRVRLTVKEKGGFEPRPLLIDLFANPCAPPKLVVAQWNLDDDKKGMSFGNSDYRLELGEMAEISVYVRNIGQGAAEKVRVDLSLAEANISCNALKSYLGNISPGELREAVFTVSVNNRYRGPEVVRGKLTISERRARFTKTRDLKMSLGKDVPKEHVFMLSPERKLGAGPTPEPVPTPVARKPVAPERRGKQYAMLIGIDKYIDRDVRKLEFAQNDIKALFRVLTDPGFGGYDHDNIFLMTPDAKEPQDRPTRNNIYLTLKWLSENVKPEDALLFVFSGHGDTDAKENVNFLIPLDGQLALPQDSSVPLSRLFAWLDACPAQRQVVMLDACHSGGPSARTKGQTKNLKIVARAFDKELGKAEEVEGRAVLASCRKDEVSYECPDLKHGVFTYYAIQGLAGRKADKDGNGTVTVYELGKYVRKEVADWCRRKRKSPTQTPRIVINDTSGEISLIGPSR